MEGFRKMVVSVGVSNNLSALNLEHSSTEAHAVKCILTPLIA